jgi:ABC-2 type transport system permease protein
VVWNGRAGAPLIRDLVEFWRYRELLWLLVARDLKVRYRNSILGFLWSFLNPLSQIAVFWFVFKFVMEHQEPNYTVKLFVAFLPWIFFLQSVTDGAACIATDAGLVRKTYFPRQILPLSVLLANLIHFLLGLSVLLALLAFLRVQFTVQFFYLLPLLLIQLVLSYGIMLIVSSLSVFYSDVRFLLGTGLQLWFFVTPVLYPVALVLKKGVLPGGVAALSHFLPLVKHLYLANPMAPIVLGYKSAMLYAGVNPIYQSVMESASPPPAELAARIAGQYPYLHYLLLSAAIALLTYIVGRAIFTRLEWQFPELA